MGEQVIGGPEPDVVALEINSDSPNDLGGGVALAEPQVKPAASIMMQTDFDKYARKANRILVRHELGKVLAVIELISPGNKNSAHAIRSLVGKLADLLFQEIHLLIVDPFPPSPRDPQGVHGLLWSEICDDSFELPADRPLTVASYQSEPTVTAWIEPCAVGMDLPTMPLFLRGEYCVNLPLETSYWETWNLLPKELKRVVET